MKDNAQDVRYYLVLQEERLALKEAMCLLNIPNPSRDEGPKPQSRVFVACGS